MKKQKGSLVGLLIASGILGISSVALVGYMQSVSVEIGSTTEQHNISFDIHTDVIHYLRSLLIETKLDKDGNKQDQNIWGVCSLIKPPTKSHGVDLVKIKLSSSLTGLAEESFSEERWQAFFNKNEYNITSNEAPCRAMDSSFQSGSFSRCFRYIGKQSETGSEVYVIARIVPKKFPDFTIIGLNGNSELDVKRVTFELQAIVGVNDEGQTSPIRYYSMAWSNEIVECDIQVQGKWINVQFSGTGTGRLSDRLVVNHPFFDDQLGICSEVEFGDIPASIIMGGHFLENGASIAADHSKNRKIACRKRVYRCPGESGQDTDFFSSIKFVMGVTNNYGGSLYFNKLNFTLLDQNGDEEDSSDDDQLSTLSVAVRKTSTYFSANEDLNPTVDLQPGFDTLIFTLMDKDPGSLADLCSRVCSGEAYYPSVSMEFDYAISENSCSYSKDYTEAPYRMGCNVCRSKMCRKIGLGVFGPMSDENGLQGLLDEPVDGVIPECALKKSTPISYALPSVSAGTGDCVAMKTTDINSFKLFGSAQYEFHNCSNSLPVLCFAYGHYLPAMELSSPGTDPTLFTGNFEQAQEACYKIGRELINEEHLAEYFKKYWPDISVDTNASVITALTTFGLSPLAPNHFEYVNNASRGIFIAPSYNISSLSNRLSQGSDSYLQKFLSSSHNKLWVAMEKDADSQLIGSIPQANVANSEFSVFTRKENPARALILKDTNPITDTDKDTLLTYNIRYKGVYNVLAGSNTHPALCSRGSGDFALSADTTLANAPDACKNVDPVNPYYFIPPLSSMEWVKAMSLLNPNDGMYPFPNPGDFTGENYSHSFSVPAPVAWVALTKKSAPDDGKRANQWRLFFPDSDSIFRTELIPIPPSPDDCLYMGVIDDKGKPVRLTMSDFLDSGSFMAEVIFRDNYQKACFDSSSGQLSLVSADGGSCGSGEVELDKDNLEDKSRSIKIMSEWVKEVKGFGSFSFIIDDTLVGQYRSQANNAYCRSNCPGCEASCDSVRNSCNGACNTIPDPVAKQTCISLCTTDRSTCRSACPNCESQCDSANLPGPCFP